jgi:hypothetical protein
LRSSDDGAGVLPRPPNATIGRTDDVAAIAERFRTAARLVTLIGAGGVGKTRLAVVRNECRRHPRVDADRQRKRHGG